jgi:hypothetical protein
VALRLKKFGDPRSRQCGILNISQPYRPPWPGTKLAFKVLGYKPEGREFETRRGDILNVPNPSCRVRSWGLLSL